MRNIFIILKKELKDIFTSPMIYSFAALFSFITGWLFFNYLAGAKDLTSLGMKDAVLIPIFGNINFLFIFLAPLLSMKCFAEEKKQSTLDLLFTLGVSEIELIFGKYLALVISAFFLLSFTCVFPIVISFSGYSDWGLIFSSYFGIAASIMCYLAVGQFCSSLSDNQIVSSVLAFVILLASMLLVASVNITNNFIFGQMVQYLSVPFHYEGFTQGLIKSYSVIFFISYISFFFLLSLKVLQARKW